MNNINYAALATISCFILSFVMGVDSINFIQKKAEERGEPVKKYFQDNSKVLWVFVAIPILLWLIGNVLFFSFF